MDYRIKPATDGGTGLIFRCMTQKSRADERDGASESKFYLPAGVTPSSEDSLIADLRKTVFGERI
jgi:hypothetical protein